MMETQATSCDYKLINDFYYYTDESSGKHYKYIHDDWTEVKNSDVPHELIKTTYVDSKSENSVTVDEEGRQYYQAEGYSLCQNADGSIYFLNEHNEWQIWDAKGKKKEHWYFYKGKDKLYRDSDSGKLYKLNQSTNEFEIVKEVKNSKHARNKDEEFDSDEDGMLSEEDEELVQDDKPLGVGTDPNITFDGKTYIKSDNTDGTTYEWDFVKRAWIPQVDDDFMAKYQMSYGFNPDGTKDENPLKFDDEKECEEEAKVPEAPAKGEEKKPQSWFEVDDRHNTKVYVTNLPLDLTEEEFVDFMQKCGLVLKDIGTSNFKIKMYKNTEGSFKGDALCTYIKVESVDLALQILHGYILDGKTIGVERAKFTQKGEYDPSFRPKKKRKRDLDKLQKKQEKLFAWTPDPMRGERAKHENNIVLKNVFETSEFENRPERILEHQEAIQLTCQTFGPVKKVKVFDRHSEGLVKVTFADIQAADMCVATLNNRLYGKRKLSASTWNGKDKFIIEETEEERKERIEKWDVFLESSKPNSN